MNFTFSKYQGAGNDFILIDNRNQLFNPQNTSGIRALCNRRFGIGADGLMLLETDPTCDFKMVYFNADGLEGTMCGNGGRCIVAFARLLGIIEKSTTFLATDGPHEATINNIDGNNMEVALQMTNVEYIESIKGGYYLDTGSPHLILFRNDLEALNITEEGKQFRYDPAFQPGGTNVNFVSIKNGELHIRTYERGVEAETLACGTGVTAAAIASFYTRKITIDKDIPVYARGGKLTVSFTARSGAQFENVFLEGPAVKVFDGAFEL